jgi:hypothetical protein
MILTAAALVSWSQTASLREAEAVRLPVSCSYVANKVMLAPSPADQLYAIVGDRERKTIRACAPGLNGKCRNWEVHRFDLMCGGRQVSWRLVAGQLLHLASAPDRRDASSRTHLEPWELRSLLAEPDFAPVDEVGGRFQQLADKSTRPPQRATDIMLPKPEPAKTVAFPLPQSEASRPSGALSPLPGAGSQASDLRTAGTEPKAQAEGTNIAAPPPPSGNADAGPADAVTLRQFDGSKREFNAASEAEMAAAATAPDAPPAANSAGQAERSVAGLLMTVLASGLLVIVVALVILGLTMWWKPAWFRLHPSSSGIVRVVYEPADEPEPDADALAEACREMMKQIAAELVNAMSAVNSLKGVPALQTALHAELESIRRSLGFTPQFRGRAGEKKDWKQIRSQLVLSLQGTQRIIGIAEAARTSFSVHPAALEVITTRLEAYAFLGVNANASETVLKKAVNALRECWHPDLATDEEDRRLREIRIKQINVAWDLITGKQMSY